MASAVLEVQRIRTYGLGQDEIAQALETVMVSFEQVRHGSRVMGHGLWVMGHGSWVMDHGSQVTMGNHECLMLEHVCAVEHAWNMNTGEDAQSPRRLPSHVGMSTVKYFKIR